MDIFNQSGYRALYDLSLGEENFGALQNDFLTLESCKQVRH
jgi:hypothetical protein